MLITQFHGKKFLPRKIYFNAICSDDILLVHTNPCESLGIYINPAMNMQLKSIKMSFLIPYGEKGALFNI